jgi:general L-amino acid transport system permease protein
VAPGIDVKHAVMGRFNFMGGTVLTPEFVAITLGLVLYSSAFTSEIIRGGIEAVNPGQWEAGYAVGLTERQALRLIVLPQALRVIVPPMTSQFINIIKNSTLALVVGFPDLNFVTATTINQTGQALEGIVILMLAFLLISALASLLMNWYHRRLALSDQR